MNTFDTIPLSKMSPKTRCQVHKISAEGKLRRRLMDLGLIPGTKIEVIRRSPFGDPTAYLIRGAVIALREEEANKVQVRKINKE